MIKGSILMKKYETGRLLGQGTFAKVYYGRDIETGQSVAIKVIDKEKVQKVGLIDQTKREISVMGLVRHPNVVELYEVMATKTKIYYVMEYAKGGELFFKVCKGRVKEDIARKYFQQLIRAVEFCHSKGVYHRDLKPENLLLDEEGNLKVTDFGLSALADNRRADGRLHTTCGTPSYVAPEVINRKGYDGAKADIWSCGVILFVLLAGHLPFNDPNLMEMYRKITEAEYKFPSWFSQDARKLLSKILDPNPRTRISIAKIKGSRWFKKGLESNPAGAEAEDIAVSAPDAVSNLSKNNAGPASLNAFDIISLSDGFDLSGMFVSNDQKDEAQFTSAQPAEAIISKLEEVAAHLGLNVKKKEAGLMKLEDADAGRDGRSCLAIGVEIFEITPSFHMVELRKLNGDTRDYQKVLQQEMRPALVDIVWAWRGENRHQQ